MRIKGWSVAGGALALVAGLTACGASVPSTHVGGAKQPTPQVQGAPVRARSTADVTKAMSVDQNARVHLQVGVGANGSTSPAVDVTITSDAAHDRFALVSKPFTIDPGDLPKGGAIAGATPKDLSVPGFELRGQSNPDQIDLYLREDGASSWTHLVVDPSLSGEVAKLSDSGKMFDGFSGDGFGVEGADGFTLEDKDTVTYNGETMTRKVATIDLAKMLHDMVPPTSAGNGAPNGTTDGLEDALGGMLASGPMADWLPKGTFEVLIDQNQFPRKVTQELTMGSGNDAFSIRMQATIDPLADGASVEMPSADQIGTTVQVRTKADLEKALGDLGLLGPDELGGN